MVHAVVVCVGKLSKNIADGAKEFSTKGTKIYHFETKADFLKTADNEKEHAKLWYKLLNGGIGTTAENLKEVFGIWAEETDSAEINESSK